MPCGNSATGKGKCILGCSCSSPHWGPPLGVIPFPSLDSLKIAATLPVSLRLSFICILTAEGESHCFGGELGGDTGGPFITPRGIGGWDTLQRVLFQAPLPEGEGDNPSVFPKDGRNWEWINSLGDGPQSLLHLPLASISRSRGQHGQHAWAWAAGTASPCSPITLQHSIGHGPPVAYTCRAEVFTS